MATDKALLGHPALRESGMLGNLSPYNTGIKTSVLNFPWQVAIRITEVGRECGGILVSPNYILTAAHCVDANYAPGVTVHTRRAVAAKSLRIFQRGQKFGTGIEIKADPDFPIQFHELWGATAQGMAYDAALIRLAQPSSERPAPLRRPRVDSGDAVVSGWGAYDASNLPSDDLRAVRLPVSDNGVCRAKLAQLPQLAGEIGEWSLCTISKTDDSCVRDSGGPLVIGAANGPQTIGIVSWGPAFDCSRTGQLGLLIGIYTRASAIVDWVERITQGDGAVTSLTPGPLMSITPITITFNAGALK